jgi:hypothetical protein
MSPQAPLGAISHAHPISPDDVDARIAVFPVVIVSGPPAAGRPDIIAYLRSVPSPERARRFHVGELEESGGFPVLREPFLKRQPADRTALIEFAGGAEQGGLCAAYERLSDEVLACAAVLYVATGADEADWTDFSSANPEVLMVRGYQVPYAVVRKGPELADRPARLGPALEAAFARLWRLRTGETTGRDARREEGKR